MLSAYSISTIGSEITVLALPLAAAVLLGASPLQMGLLGPRARRRTSGSPSWWGPGSTGCPAGAR